MDLQFNQWKLAIERLAVAAPPDFREVALLVGKIAETSTNKTLRQAASQALPSLRNAAAWSADQATKDIGRRRLGLFMEAMHTLTAPSFAAHPPQSVISVSLSAIGGCRAVIGR